MSEVVGEIIGNFTIVSKIGSGGMGEVYLAEQNSIKTKVAIKTLAPHISADADQVKRFFNEAIAVSRIKHAGIVKIFDVGFLPCGRAYLAMEYLEGETLGRRIRRAGRLSLAQLADIARQIASILDATHQAGITHRDLKPDNVFLVPDAELESGQRVKILDFGIAKLSGVNLTQPSVGTMGTPDYMAPEQWRDSRSVDWHVDAYALGCLAFEMATGRVPFPSASIAESYAQHLRKPPPAMRELVPELPQALDALVAQLLAKRPEHRPATMRAIARAFAALGTGAPVSRPILACPTVASGTGLRVSMQPTMATSRTLLVLLASIGVLLLGILITLVVALEERDEIALVPAPISATTPAHPR